MNRPELFNILALAIFCFLFQSTLHAEVLLEAPEKVARGDAFLARAFLDSPANTVDFSWRGVPYKAMVLPGNRENFPWEAQILLPVPLDEKQNLLILEAADRENSSANVQKQISVFDKKRPVQKLVVDKKYVSPPAHELERIKLDREKVRNALQQVLPQRLWILPLHRPVPGSVSSLFGMKRVFNGEPRSVHRGLDLRAPTGTPIGACADGQVALVDNLYYSGNTVYLNHGGGVFSAYLHMSKPLVRQGEFVRRGQPIGLSGATGRVTGPHLHLSLFTQGESVDPQPFLEQATPKQVKSAGAYGQP